MNVSAEPVIRLEGIQKVFITDEVETHALSDTHLERELHRGGATICMVTHDPRCARYADRAVHLLDGRVVKEEDRAKSQEQKEVA